MSKYVFDDFYADYDSWYQTPMGAFVDRVETDCALGLLEPAAGQSVLDAGCCTGNFSLKLAEMGCRVTAVDVAEKMMDQARQKAVRAGADIRFLREDMAELPFGDGSFDRVLTMAAFEFLPDPARAVRELLRVLRPGGVLVIGTIEKGGPWAGLYESDAMAGTAYERACFLTGESIAAMAPEAFETLERCLFVAPGAPEGDFTPEGEAAAKAAGARGGFVCLRFRKK